MNEKIIFESDVECYSCNGTGLYKGMAEKWASAVVCYTCNGTGKKHVKHIYNKFTGRKIRNDIKRVYKTAAGYGISDVDCNGIKFSQAGCDYTDWLKGETPKPIKDLHCLLQHYGQGSVEIEAHFKYMCENGLRCGEYISKCPMDKAKCWKIFEENLNE